MAPGATRSRIAGQLLTESVLLARRAADCGVPAVDVDARAVCRHQPACAGPRRRRAPGHDGDDLRAVVPSWPACRSACCRRASSWTGACTTIWKQGGRSGPPDASAGLRGALVAAQVALSLMLPVGAGLTIKSLVRLQRVPAGFDADGVLTAYVNLPAAPLQRRDAESRRSGIALESLRSIPGVDVGRAGSRLPSAAATARRGLTIDGRDSDAAGPPTTAPITPDYFRALGIPLLRGRGTPGRGPRDAAARRGRHASMAARYWPGVDPIGHRTAIDDGQTDHGGRVSSATCITSRWRSPPQPTLLHAVPSGSVGHDAVRAPHSPAPPDARASRDSDRDFAGGQGPTGRCHADDERIRVAIAGEPPVQRHAAHGALAGSRSFWLRSVSTACSRSSSANGAGNRRPHGARRLAARHRREHAWAKGCGWTAIGVVAGIALGARRDATAECAALWHQPDGCRDRSLAPRRLIVTIAAAAESSCPPLRASRVDPTDSRLRDE